IIAQCATLASPDVHVAWTQDKRLYLINKSESNKDVSGELFGYNIGQWQQKPKGLVQAATKEAIPWLLETDTKLLVCVDKSATPPRKQLRCLAEIAHDLCSRHGLTEMSVVDHDVAALLNQD
ncbi:unnamed protein product, partial [Symbiodinium sp. CCMP2592]